MMDIKFMRTRYYYVAATLVVIMAVAALVYIATPQSKPTATPAPTPTLTPTPTPTSPPAPTPTPTPTGTEAPIPRPHIPKEHYKRVSLEEARSMLPFKLLAPTYTAGLRLQRVTVTPPPPKYTPVAAYLMYSNNTLADYSTSDMLWYNNRARSTGELPEGVPELIIIVEQFPREMAEEDAAYHREHRGSRVTTLESGELAYGKDEVLIWWDGVVHYEAHGPNLTFEQLVEIANSGE